MQAAKGRPVVLLNPRMVHMPRETADYDTIYLLRQFNVQPIKIDPRVSTSGKEHSCGVLSNGPWTRLTRKWPLRCLGYECYREVLS